MIPLFLDLLGVLILAFYFYATLGEKLFGGQLKTNLSINFSQYGDPAYYVYVNFNDFCNGIYTCFHLLIVNNWLYTVSIRVMVWLNERLGRCALQDNGKLQLQDLLRVVLHRVCCDLSEHYDSVYTGTFT